MDSISDQTTNLRPLTSGFDLASVRGLTEIRMCEAIRKNEDLMARYQKHHEAFLDCRRAIVLKLQTTNYRVDVALTPSLHKLGGDCLCAILRIVQPLDLYVDSSLEFNACCYPSTRGNGLKMVLNAGLIAAMTPHEILAVMGHEAGHSLIGNAAWLPVINYDMEEFSQLEVAQRIALECREEMTCDRVSLLASQDLTVACKALFKVTTGLPENWVTFDASVYAKHFDDITRLAELGSIEDFRVHPLTPMRVKALIAFSKSEPYARAIGSQEWELSAEDLDKACEQMLSVIEPDLTCLISKNEKDAWNSFVLDGALLVVTADGKISPEEVQWFKKRGFDLETIKKMAEDTDLTDKTCKRLKAAAQLLNKKLSACGRADTLRKVCTVALVSGSIPAQESEVIDYLRGLLGLNANLARQAQQFAQSDVQAESNPAPTQKEEASIAPSHSKKGRRGKKPEESA